jgi:hypothetical protein
MRYYYYAISFITLFTIVVTHLNLKLNILNFLLIRFYYFFNKMGRKFIDGKIM